MSRGYITGHVALIRTLRGFMETSGLPWNVKFITDRDDNGDPVWDDERIEISFTYKDRPISVVIWAPGMTLAKPDGTLESLPLGRLAARIEGEVVKGPIDQKTWDDILKLANQEGAICPTN